MAVRGSMRKLPERFATRGRGVYNISVMEKRQ
jgi:hypothetical protein